MDGFALQICKRKRNELNFWQHRVSCSTKYEVQLWWRRVVLFRKIMGLGFGIERQKNRFCRLQAGCIAHDVNLIQGWAIYIFCILYGYICIFHMPYNALHIAKLYGDFGRFWGLFEGLRRPMWGPVKAYLRACGGRFGLSSLIVPVAGATGPVLKKTGPVDFGLGWLNKFCPTYVANKFCSWNLTNKFCSWFFVSKICSWKFDQKIIKFFF